MKLKNFTLDVFIFLFGMHHSVTVIQVNQFFKYQETGVNVEMAAQRSTITALSVLRCAMICDRMVDFCHSFTYNSTEKTCTPGSWLSPGITPKSNPGAVYYAKGYFCDPGKGLRTLVNGSTKACLFLSDSFANYTQAISNCQALGGILYTVKTQEKLNIFIDVLKNNTYRVWIGLDDIAVEGVFRWVDDNSILNTPFTFFASGEPNNGGNQDCVSTCNITYPFDDNYCSSELKFLCEIF